MCSCIKFSSFSSPQDIVQFSERHKAVAKQRTYNATQTKIAKDNIFCKWHMVRGDGIVHWPHLKPIFKLPPPTQYNRWRGKRTGPDCVEDKAGEYNWSSKTKAYVRPGSTSNVTRVSHKCYLEKKKKINTSSAQTLVLTSPVHYYKVATGEIRNTRKTTV